MAYIYKITNDINGKIYIGKTHRTIHQRWLEHCRNKDCEYRKSRPLYRAMNKYGIEHFHIEEIEKCNYFEAEEREKYWIEYYDSFKYGYNATVGGDGKPYIDRQLVIDTYSEFQNCSETANALHICVESVRHILKENNVEIKSGSSVIAEKNGKAVIMQDLNEKTLLVFSNQTEAARWLVNNQKTTSKDLTKISIGIGRVANGKRKTAYGYKWKRKN